MREMICFLGVGSAAVSLLPSPRKMRTRHVRRMWTSVLRPAIESASNSSRILG